MEKYRSIKETWKSIPTVEGAGVRLKRVFGYHQVPKLDPFLLMDDFHSKNPEDYLAGFPWHPHRGIETVSYVIHGELEHGDSLGNSGTIRSGDVQWMTAGSGIIHQEMPQKPDDNLLWGFQLWVNLPGYKKMMDPRYQEISSKEITEISLQNGIFFRLIAGELEGKTGPVKDIICEPFYADCTLPPGSDYEFTLPEKHTVFVYVIQGRGLFSPADDTDYDEETLVLFDRGEKIKVSSGSSKLRFLIAAGKPLKEPVAWSGPIVMTTDEQIETAFREYADGTFIKKK